MHINIFQNITYRILALPTSLHDILMPGGLSSLRYRWLLVIIRISTARSQHIVMLVEIITGIVVVVAVEGWLSVLLLDGVFGTLTAARHVWT